MSTVDGEGDDPRVCRTTMPLESAGERRPAPEHVAGVGLPEALGGRFVPLRNHARGGLGEVFLARDEELGRVVALKTLQVRLADEPRTRARFVREAEITGHLEHPGIVPVYGLGRSPDGRPYYAMQFIQGESLDTTIQRFHTAEGPGRKPGERAIALLHLLNCFQSVCNAVDFAHSRGVVHRDLKPSNIMLGHHGETLVVDWGLAKQLPHSEQEIASAETPLVLGPITDSDLTLPGSTVGTPAFMSPEQAEGRTAELGPASDIYNLGATLYCILAGRAPFEESDARLIFARLKQGDIPRPSAVAKGRIALALEAICLKAMALRPEDRYPSARALGEDIQRWIAHEPVSAYNESLGERLARFSRRHRTWVQAGTAALLSLLVVLAVATVMVARAYREEQVERLESERLATSLDLDKALALSEEGSTGRGMLRFAHALALAPRQAGDLRTTILANLAAWRGPLHPLRDILAHQGVVYVAAFSPDGRTIATGSGTFATGSLRGEARLWNAETGHPLGPPLRHSAPLRTIAFSPDGQLLLTGSLDGNAQLWDVESGHAVGSPLAHDAAVEEVAFFPDGRTFATVAGRHVRFWNAATRERLPSLPELPAPVHALAISGDGRRIATGDESGMAYLWDPEVRTAASAPLVHHAAIQCAAFSPDGKTLLTGGDAGHVLFWDVATGQRLMPRLEHRSTVYSVAFHPDGKLIVTGSDDNTARVWDARTGQAVGAPLEHLGSVMWVGFSPRGRGLLTASGDATARLWDAAPGREGRMIAEHDGPILDLAFRPDGDALVTGDSAGVAQVWDTRTFVPLGPPFTPGAAVQLVGYSPDGATLLTACRDGTARLWDAKTRSPSGRQLTRVGPAPVAAFSPDGKLLLTGSDGPQALLWNTATGELEGAPLPQPTEVTAVAFSPAGDRIVVAAGPIARLWDLATRRPLGLAMTHHGKITAAAFRPDGRVVVTCGEDNMARRWYASSGQPLGDPLSHPATVTTIAFSPDGGMIVTGCNDRRVRLWNATTGKPIGPPMVHVGRITAVSFSPDGRLIASASLDQTARLWDVAVPLRDDVDRIELWVQVLTGMRLDTRDNSSGVIHSLDDATWHRSRLRLEKMGGIPFFSGR